MLISVAIWPRAAADKNKFTLIYYTVFSFMPTESNKSNYEFHTKQR